MALNTNIALGVQPTQQPNMLAQYGQMMALKAAQQETQGNEALRAAYASGGDLSNPEFRRKIMAANPQLGSKLINQFSEMSARDVKTQAESLKAIKDSIGLVNSPTEMIDFLKGAYSTPGGALLTKLAPFDRAVANIPQDPKSFEEYKRKFSLSADKLFTSAADELAAKTRIQAANIGAAAPMMNAKLSQRQYDDKLAAGGDIITSLVTDPETGEDVSMQFKRNLKTGNFEPVVIQPPIMRVDISPNSVTSSTVPSGAGGDAPNVLATQVAPQAAPTPNVNALNPNAPAPVTPTFARSPTKDPSGALAAYRKTADGKGLEPIPGGPADPTVQARQSTVKLSAKDIQAREAKYPQATSALKAFEAKTGKFERDIDELIENKKGLDEITGFLAGRTDLSAMSDAGRRALALFNTITAKGGFSELQDMRNASPTGGALGNVSNQEGKQLIDSFGALSRTQSGDDLRKSLATAQSDLQNLRQRMKEAYDLTYEYKRSGDVPAVPSGFKID
jgi:hypothetical protein